MNQHLAFLIVALVPTLALQFAYLHWKNRRDRILQQRIDEEISRPRRGPEVPASPKIPRHVQPPSPPSAPQVVSDEDIAEVLHAVSLRMTDPALRGAIIPIPRTEPLPLDHSLESLFAVDRWMEGLAKRQANLSREALEESLLWAGAYVGEVIRLHSPQKLRWTGWHRFMQDKDASLRQMLPLSWEYQYILANPEGKATFPFSKVSKFLDNGPEESLWFFAKGTIDPEAPGTA